MHYTQLPNTDEETEALLKTKHHLDELRSYPIAERMLTALSKAFLAILVGGSTVIAFIVFAPPLSIFAVIFFSIGALGYAVKAVHDAYRKSKKEKKYTQKIIDDVNEIHALLTDDFFQKINKLLQLSKSNQLDQDETEDLFAYLFEIKNILTIVSPQNEKLVEVKAAIQSVEEKVRHFRNLSNDDACLPNMSRGVVSFDEPKLSKSLTPARILKKMGNRTLSFLGGASSALGIGLTVAALGFGIATPVGWALIGIVVTSCLVGLISVVVDYHLARHEEDKIKEMKVKHRELRTLKKGTEVLQNSMQKLTVKVGDRLEKQCLKEEKDKLIKENAQLKSKFNTIESSRLGLQANSIFCPDPSIPAQAAVSCSQSSNTLTPVAQFGH